jgi:hypothetical protein
LKLEPSDFQKNIVTIGFSSPSNNKNYKNFFLSFFLRINVKTKIYFVLEKFYWGERRDGGINHGAIQEERMEWEA